MKKRTIWKFPWFLVMIAVTVVAMCANIKQMSHGSYQSIWWRKVVNGHIDCALLLCYLHTYALQICPIVDDLIVGYEIWRRIHIFLLVNFEKCISFVYHVFLEWEVDNKGICNLYYQFHLRNKQKKNFQNVCRVVGIFTVRNMRYEGNR